MRATITQTDSPQLQRLRAAWKRAAGDPVRQAEIFCRYAELRLGLAVDSLQPGQRFPGSHAEKRRLLRDLMGDDAWSTAIRERRELVIAAEAVQAGCRRALGRSVSGRVDAPRRGAESRPRGRATVRRRTARRSRARSSGLASDDPEPPRRRLLKCWAACAFLAEVALATWWAAAR